MKPGRSRTPDDINRDTAIRTSEMPSHHIPPKLEPTIVTFDPDTLSRDGDTDSITGRSYPAITFDDTQKSRMNSSKLEPTPGSTTHVITVSV
jgi:hypothetical protein